MAESPHLLAQIAAIRRSVEIIGKYMMRNYAISGNPNRRTYRRNSAQTQYLLELNRRKIGAEPRIDRGHAERYARCACATPSVKTFSAQSSCHFPLFPPLAPTPPMAFPWEGSPAALAH